jgi:hypothetical protein
MTEQTNTTTPTGTQQDDTLLDSARTTLGNAGGAIRDAVDGVVDAAKENPATAAAIAAGAAAAVAGAAFGISKLREQGNDKK